MTENPETRVALVKIVDDSQARYQAVLASNAYNFREMGGEAGEFAKYGRVMFTLPGEELTALREAQQFVDDQHRENPDLELSDVKLALGLAAIKQPYRDISDVILGSLSL